MISEPKLPLANLPNQTDPETPLVEPARNFRVHLWARRLWVLLFVFVCATTGVLLLILPWRPEWTDNHLLLSNPGLRSFVASGFMRGICSGLGLLDIWIGFSEAIHYHEAPRA